MSVLEKGLYLWRVEGFQVEDRGKRIKMELIYLTEHLLLRRYYIGICYFE